MVVEAGRIYAEYDPETEAKNCPSCGFAGLPLRMNGLYAIECLRRDTCGLRGPFRTTPEAGLEFRKPNQRLRLPGWPN
jgi:hypothetical protein